MGRVDVTEIVRPCLQKLMRRCGETVHFVEREEENCVYIDKVEAPQNQVCMVSHVGGVLPFYRSAVGKALAALDIREEHTRYAFSISVPIMRMDNDRIRELSEYVREAKEEIAAAFR